MIQETIQIYLKKIKPEGTLFQSFGFLLVYGDFDSVSYLFDFIIGHLPVYDHPIALSFHYHLLQILNAIIQTYNTELMFYMLKT